MDSRTKANSIRVLTELRDVYQGQLDASVVVQINEVIAALKEDGGSGDIGPKHWTLRALDLIGEVLKIVTNVSELMR